MTHLRNLWVVSGISIFSAEHCIRKYPLTLEDVSGVHFGQCFLVHELGFLKVIINIFYFDVNILLSIGGSINIVTAYLANPFQNHLSSTYLSDKHVHYLPHILKMSLK